jgi:hypothetical protein
MTANLTKFHNLDEIHFILDRRETLGLDFVNSWKESVMDIFEVEKKTYPESSIPKVICVSWKVKEAMELLKLEHRP